MRYFIQKRVKILTVGFFGHKEVYEDITEKLKEIIIKLINEDGAKVFYVGNHGAFDRKVAHILHQLKKEYDIKAEIVIAYINSKEDLLDTVYPDGLEFVPKRFAIIKRNEWIIEKSDIVIVYVRKTFGGAYNAKNLAQKKNKKIIEI